MRETETTVKIGESTYMVKKFPALTGAFFLKFCLEKVMPAMGVLQEALLPEKETKGKKDSNLLKGLMSLQMDDVISKILPVLSSISQEDMQKIMTQCLCNTYKMLPAGLHAVMTESGNFGIQELEYDTVTCLKLCFHVIKFNVQGFFGEGGFLSPPNSKTLLQ